MKDLIRVNEVITMTSLEVVDLINKFRAEEGNEKVKEHKTLMRDIRKELESLENVGIINEYNFVLVNYTDSKGEKRPCYKMNKSGIMQMLNKESALVRYKTQQYIEALEKKLKQPQQLSTLDAYRVVSQDVATKYVAAVDAYNESAIFPPYTLTKIASLYDSTNMQCVKEECVKLGWIRHNKFGKPEIIEPDYVTYTGDKGRKALTLTSLGYREWVKLHPRKGRMIKDTNIQLLLGGNK